MEDKTNVMRILDKGKIQYTPHTYVDSGAVSGMEVAAALSQEPERVFKTLVTVGKSENHYVFMLPVNRELDLRKAAKCVGEKKIDMIKASELLPLTGYIHGGCSPIGMKKRFRTVIDSGAAEWETIYFSAGRVGYQVEMSLTELRRTLTFELGDISE